MCKWTNIPVRKGSSETKSNERTNHLKIRCRLRAAGRRRANKAWARAWRQRSWPFEPVESGTFKRRIGWLIGPSIGQVGIQSPKRSPRHAQSQSELITMKNVASWPFPRCVSNHGKCLGASTNCAILRRLMRSTTSGGVREPCCTNCKSLRHGNYLGATSHRHSGSR